MSRRPIIPNPLAKKHVFKVKTILECTRTSTRRHIIAAAHARATAESSVSIRRASIQDSVFEPRSVSGDESVADDTLGGVES